MTFRLPGGWVISRGASEPTRTDPEPVQDSPPGEPDTAEPEPARKPKRAKREKHHVLLRLFGIGIWGTFKLIVLCVLVGFFVMAASFDPRSPDVNVGETLGSLATQAFAATGWAVRNFWKPALAGASIVLPLWVLWRLISLPFRR